PPCVVGAKEDSEEAWVEPQPRQQGDDAADRDEHRRDPKPLGQQLSAEPDGDRRDPAGDPGAAPPPAGAPGGPLPSPLPAQTVGQASAPVIAARPMARGRAWEASAQNPAIPAEATSP